MKVRREISRSEFSRRRLLLDFGIYLSLELDDWISKTNRTRCRQMFGSSLASMTLGTRMHADHADEGRNYAFLLFLRQQRSSVPHPLHPLNPCTLRQRCQFRSSGDLCLSIQAVQRRVIAVITSAVIHRAVIEGGGVGLTDPDTKAPDRKSTRLNSSHLVISYA